MQRIGLQRDTLIQANREVAAILTKAETTLKEDYIYSVISESASAEKILQVSTHSL